MAKENGNITKWRGQSFHWISVAYLLLIYGIPTIGVFAALKASGRFELVVVTFIPIVWSVGFLVTAGTLSLFHQFAIKPGKFRRSVSDRLYYHRRIYGLCWTAVYYNKPVYFLCLSSPPLKSLTFHLFGYRNQHRSEEWLLACGSNHLACEFSGRSSGDARTRG